MKNLKTLNDQTLYSLAKKYGKQSLMWRRKFIGLLPEIQRRKLYEKKGCMSIFEFGKKLAGLSEDQIRRALNLERKFEETPILKSMLIEGKVSVNKLARVASVVTTQNEEMMAEAVTNLSNRSLEVFVKDVKNCENNIKNTNEENSLFQNKNGLNKAQIEIKSVHVHRFEEVNLDAKLSNEVKEKLNELNQKGFDVNDILLEMLQKREEEIKVETERVEKEIEGREVEKVERGKSVGRYISVKTKRILKKEYGNVCAIKACRKEAKHLHHLIHHSLSATNVPTNLIPLCREHHDITHSINQKYLEKKQI